jgi:hypothetical protein
MVGHKWEPAEGTIVNCQPDMAAQGRNAGPQSVAYDRGQLSQGEFDAKRQQILDEI